MGIELLSLLRIGLPAALLLGLIGAPLPGAAAEAGPAVEPLRVMVQLDDGSWEARTVHPGPPSELLALTQSSDILDIRPMRVYSQLGASVPPSDPTYPSQWHLTRNQAPRSWRHGDGSGVTVAVIDSGVAPTSDLACHSYVAPFDFRPGGGPFLPSDSNGHGTFVTAVLAECTDNALSGAGTAPGVTVMPIGVLDSSGLTDTFSIYQALYWALDHGADIVNLSLGLSCTDSYPACSDPALNSAISDLVDAGVVIVAAAGNDGSGHLAYPANHPSVVAVGASSYDAQRADYSSFGSGLDLVAPTGDSGDPTNRRGVIHQGVSGDRLAQGTSFSAPQVAGALAILRSAGFSSVAQAWTALLQSADDISSSGYDTATGHGDLRIREALAWGGAGITPPIADAGSQVVGDFTGEGRSDALTYDKRFGRWWALVADGLEFVPDEWTRLSTVTGWSSRLVGDFNGDGRDDLASYHPGTGNWVVSRSTGSGFTNSVWSTFSTKTGWARHVVGDFNNDGRDDIANYHPSNGNWVVSRSTGSDFSNSVWSTFSTKTGWARQLVGDFNGDDRDDIANYHPGSGNWVVSRSTGNGFSSRTWSNFSTKSGWSRQLVGDFNGDDRDDIANYHPGSGNWVLSRSTGSDFSNSVWSTFSTKTGWNTQAAGDFNGDGRDDIANYHPGSGNWVISRSTGGGFTNSVWSTFSTKTGWSAQLVGDFNADDRADVANYHAANGSWVVSRSTGAGFTNRVWHD